MSDRPKRPKWDQRLLDEAELDPETSVALHGLNPEWVWTQIIEKVSTAVFEHPDESNDVCRECDLSWSLDRLYWVVDSAEPEDGLNLIMSISADVDLTNIRQEDPLIVLRWVVDIFTISDLWACR